MMTTTLTQFKRKGPQIGTDITWKYPENIVQCEWLSKRFDDKSIRVFDCTTYLLYRDQDPSKPYDVESDISKYKESHIPGSAFLDLQNDLSKKGSPYSFTLPNFLDLKNSFQHMCLKMLILTLFIC